MSRRNFLMKLGSGMIGALIVRPSFTEPNWIWDRTRFDVYDPNGGDLLTESDIVKIELEKIMKRVPALFERDDLFYSTIKNKNMEVISSREMRVPFGYLKT